MYTTDRVRELLTQRGMTLWQLCRDAGLSYSTISSASRRNGQLNFDTVELICGCLGITMSEFFAEYENYRKKSA